MFFQKLFNNQKDMEPTVYVNMQNIDDNIEQNGNSVIIIDDQNNAADHRNGTVCICPLI